MSRPTSPALRPPTLLAEGLAAGVVIALALAMAAARPPSAEPPPSAARPPVAEPPPAAELAPPAPVPTTPEGRIAAVVAAARAALEDVARRWGTPRRTGPGETVVVSVDPITGEYRPSIVIVLESGRRGEPAQGKSAQASDLDRAVAELESATIEARRPVAAALARLQPGEAARVAAAWFDYRLGERMEILRALPGCGAGRIAEFAEALPPVLALSLREAATLSTALCGAPSARLSLLADLDAAGGGGARGEAGSWHDGITANVIHALGLHDDAAAALPLLARIHARPGKEIPAADAIALLGARTEPSTHAALAAAAAVEPEKREWLRQRLALGHLQRDDRLQRVAGPAGARSPWTGE